MDKDDAKTILKGFLILAGIVLYIILMPMACTSPVTAQKTLEDNGYTHVQTTGYRWFTCDNHDLFSTGFTAVSPSGKPVSGAVCSGLFKGNTIRFD